jgi:hypothetical protein
MDHKRLFQVVANKMVQINIYHKNKVVAYKIFKKSDLFSSVFLNSHFIL